MLDISNSGLYVMDVDDGEIPPFIFTLPALCYLDLSNNQLSGHVQDFDTTTSRLKSLFLSNNALSGFIPKAFFELTSLGALDVSSNNFTGSLDLSHFWRLHELTMLDLSNNWLHVMDADDDNLVDISYLSELQDIRLASCNVIRFPRFLRQVKSISYLDLSRNKIDGNVPNWLWDKLWSFAPYLNLSHNMFTGMQLINSYILPFSTSMEVLDLSFNRFSGRVPMPSSSGEVLEYSNNMFSSLVPNWTLYLRDTIYFSISKNNINDQLPPSICDAILDVLDLSNNNFYGPIPSCIIENMTHTILNLRGNNFNGTLPTDIMTTCDLQVLDLHEYNSSGETIDFDSNNYSYEPFYRYSIEFTYKGYFMTFERMLTTVTLIDFSNNRLEGTIPEALGSLLSLRILNLSHNNFIGNIPAQLGSLTDLESLDLSCNQLLGEIPQELTDLTFLATLNLSDNDLVGRIPQSRQFSTFGSSSFGGNPRLCGPPLSEFPCGASPSPYTPSAQLVHRSSPNSFDVVLFLFIGLGFGVGFAAAIVVKWNRVGRWFIANARALHR
ncbi:Cf2-like protein [Zea mays]|uniref:Cf2-like protein n=1 Tax=Zea mays TaxID=4577 RepID=Q6J9V5_MAIZE|nr:cf2-like protein [Zea mays]AQK41746.1 Cf2-like protein [Zea mays]